MRSRIVILALLSPAFPTRLRSIVCHWPSYGTCWFVAAIVMLLGSSSAFTVNASVGGESNIVQKDASLKEALEKGLRARRPTEFAFIGRVVAMVDQGRLPLDVVRGTFNWARKKKPYPFPFFERGLKHRAAKIGIVVK